MGRPVHDDRTLFEFLILEGAQAGLSWETILNKRENYRAAFDGFDVRKVARYDRRKIAQLLNNPGHRAQPIEDRIRGAEMPRRFCECRKNSAASTATSGSSWTDKPRVNSWKAVQRIPASTEESDAMSKDLKKRGFNFVGSTICYAFMQAVGMVNDHVLSVLPLQAKADHDVRRLNSLGLGRRRIGFRWSARGWWHFLRILVVKVEAEGGVLVGPSYSYGNNFSLALLLEKRFHHFEQECLGATAGIRDLCIHLHSAAQINPVVDQIISSMQAGGGTGNSE